MGVVVRRYIDILTIIINFPYFTCVLALFWQQHPYFLKCFVVLVYVILYNIIYSKRYSKNIRDRLKKIENTRI